MTYIGCVCNILSLHVLQDRNIGDPYMEFIIYRFSVYGIYGMYKTPTIYRSYRKVVYRWFYVRVIYCTVIRIMGYLY